jgi:hypothetical protein
MASCTLHAALAGAYSPRAMIFGFLLLASHGSAFAGEEAGIIKLGTTYWMAKECRITIRPDVERWLEELGTKSATADQVHELRPRVEEAVKAAFAADGKIITCIALRASLYRDGWL